MQRLEGGEGKALHSEGNTSNYAGLEHLCVTRKKEERGTKEGEGGREGERDQGGGGRERGTKEGEGGREGERDQGGGGRERGTKEGEGGRGTILQSCAWQDFVARRGRFYPHNIIYTKCTLVLNSTLYLMHNTDCRLF